MGDFNMTQWVNFKMVREHLSFCEVFAYYGIVSLSFGLGRLQHVQTGKVARSHK